MQISLRSYLTAGVSLTAASAIALTPLAIPANERAVTIPNVTVSDIQLTVTPAEIQAFFADLQAELVEFNAALADAVALPGATLAGALEIAIETNTDFFDTLSGLTTNETLLGLINALYLSSNYGLTSLQDAVEEGTENIAITTGDLADLLASTITGSLSNVLSSFVNVLNNPLETSAYASLLSFGLVDTVQDIAANGVSAVQVLSDSGFGFLYTGLDLLDSQIFNAIDTVADLMDVAAGATGSDLVQAVNAAIQSVTLAPALALNNAAFGLANDVFGGFQDGIDDILGGAQSLIAVTGGSLQAAITAIGANPLDPDNYLFAGGALLNAGFTDFNIVAGTVGSVANIPFERGISMANGLSELLVGLNNNFAQAFSSVLAALGLPDDIVSLPLEIAAGINELIGAGTEAVVAGLQLGSDIVTDTTAAVIEVSNDIRNAILGEPPLNPTVAAAAAEPETAAFKSAASESAGEPAGDPAGDVVPVSNESEDEEEAPVEEAPTEEAPAEEAPAEETTDDEAPADDEAGDDDDAAGDDDAADDDSDSKSSYGSRTEDKKADKAAAAEKKSDSDSSDSSSNSSSDSGSDSGSDSE